MMSASYRLEDALRALVEDRADEALAIFQALAPSSHQDTGFWFGMLLLALQQRDLPRAEALLLELSLRLQESGLDHLPDWILPHFCLLFQFHQWRAVPVLILALDSAEREASVRYLLWEQALTLGWIQLENFEIVLQNSPWAHGWELLGKHFLRQGQYQAALALWLEKLPQSGNEILHLPVAQFYLQVGQQSLAQSHFLDYLKSHQDASVYFVLGRLYLANLDLSSAKQALTSACQIEPKHDLWQIQRQLAHLPIESQQSESEQQLANLLQQAQALKASVKLSDCLPDLWQGAMDPFYDLNYLTEHEGPWRRAYADIFVYPEPPDYPEKALENRLGYLITPGHEPMFLFIFRQMLPALSQVWRIDLLVFESSRLLLTPLAEQSGVRLEILDRNLEQAIQQIYANDYDLFNCWEAGVDPLAYFLSGFQLGRKQFTGWESAASTWHPRVSYFLAAATLDADPADFSEQLVQMPVLPLLPALENFVPSPKTRTDFGLPEGLLIAVPHNLLKFSLPFVDCLKALLQANTQLKLVLIESPQSAWTKAIQVRLQQSLQQSYAQIIWLPRQSPTDLMAVLKRCDFILDAFPFGAGKIAFDAAALGVPILSLQGKQLRGRISAAVYQQMQISGLTTASTTEYLARAQELIDKPQLLSDYRQQILAKQHLVLENAAVIPAYLDALETIANT